MRTGKKILMRGIACLCGGVLLFASSVLAQELSYDPYVEELRGPAESPSRAERSLQHFLVYPFEIVRYVTDETLVFVEKHHLYKKGKWIYDKMQSYGVTPHFGFVNLGNRSYGADVDFISLSQRRENFPDAVLSGWIRRAEDGYLKTGSKIGWSRIAGTGVQTFGRFNYEKRPEEHFYGIGPHSSAGEGSVYSMEETTLEAVLGYGKDPRLGFDLTFGYHNVNISGGKGRQPGADWRGPLF